MGGWSISTIVRAYDLDTAYFMGGQDMRCVVGLLSFAMITAADAAVFTPGNILVTNGSDNSHRVYEYTRTGQLVQTINVPTVSGQGSTEYNRDVLVDSHGRLQVFNGTFTPYISTFDPSTSVWQHRTTTGFAIVNNVTYGKLATYDRYVFATSGSVGAPKIFRLDTDTGAFTPFATQNSNDGPIDLTMGHNGLLYALNGEGSPSGRFIQVFDPQTLALISTITLPLLGMSSRSIAVDSSGYIYLNQLYGPVYKLTPDGQQVVASATYTQTSYVDDMDFSPDGLFMMTQFDGRVCLLDSNLQQIRTFNTTNYYASGSFGAFIVPEPVCTAYLGCLAFVLFPIRRTQRK
jgi:WD40 repeat protein